MVKCTASMATELLTEVNCRLRPIVGDILRDGDDVKYGPYDGIYGLALIRVAYYEKMAHEADIISAAVEHFKQNPATDSDSEDLAQAMNAVNDNAASAKDLYMLARGYERVVITRERMNIIAFIKAAGDIKPSNVKDIIKFIVPPMFLLLPPMPM